MPIRKELRKNFKSLTGYIFCPYWQMTVAKRRSLKLSPRYYNPFQISQRVEKVAYRLDLPIESKIYPVFHVSCLKKKVGEQVRVNLSLHWVMEDGTMALDLEKILDRRLKRKGAQAGVDLLVQWRGAMEEDAT